MCVLILRSTIHKRLTWNNERVSLSRRTHRASRVAKGVKQQQQAKVNLFMDFYLFARERERERQVRVHCRGEAKEVEPPSGIYVPKHLGVYNDAMPTAAAPA